MIPNNEMTVKQLLPLAIEVLEGNLEKDFCCISWMQRKLRIGYNKASELIDLLEDKEFIEAPDSIGKRKILKRS